LDVFDSFGGSLLSLRKIALLCSLVFNIYSLVGYGFPLFAGYYLGFSFSIVPVLFGFTEDGGFPVADVFLLKKAVTGSKVVSSFSTNMMRFINDDLRVIWL
jgi:hypothetical protein